MSETAPPTSKPTRRRVAAALLLAVLTVQVAVPAVRQLTHERTVRFSWQMYSQRSESPEVEAVFKDGEVAPFYKSHVGAPRVEVQLDADLLSRVCAVEPEITEFRIHRSGAPSVVQCGDHR